MRRELILLAGVHVFFLACSGGPDREIALDAPGPGDARVEEDAGLRIFLDGRAAGKGGAESSEASSRGAGAAGHAERDATSTDTPAPDAVDAAEESVLPGEQDGEAGAIDVVPGRTCAQIRVCMAAGAGRETCSAGASPEARAEADVVLICEEGLCFAGCGPGGSRRACNDCLLQGCSLAFETCARASGCGDGVLDPATEECDDGNTAEPRSCTSACTERRSADAASDGRAPADAADGAAFADGTDGTDDADDAAFADVIPNDDGSAGDRDAPPPAAACGDGIVQEDEACDDGNSDPFDRCSNHCAAAAEHLLITEVVTRPNGAEMIEIVNPTRAVIDLSSYALSDNHLYYRVATGSFSTSSGSDFAARFPAGSFIAPGAYRTVALSNADGGSVSFRSVYGKKPDFELRPLANGAEDDPDVANMQSMTQPTSIGATASLTDAGEPIVLFFYRGGDRVEDVDYVVYGAASTANPVVDKTGIPAGASMYRPDTGAAAQSILPAPADGGALHRCSYAEPGEAGTIGNGLTGHDATAERLVEAFAVSAGSVLRTPGTPPPPGLCP
jgi:cysteine-rich repeat protein